MKIKLGLILLMITVIILVSGCAPPAGNDESIEPISIQTLLENREYYNEKDIAIKGTIIAQCSRGCMFNVADGTGVIFVQMLREAWERPLPQSIGRPIEIRGTFYQAPQPHIIVARPEQARVG